MKFNLCKSGVACLFLLGVLAVSRPADASLQLSLAEDGGGFVVEQTNPSGTTVSFSGAFGDFSIDLVAGTSNSPGVSPQSTENVTTLVIHNNSGGTHTLHVLVSDTGFTFPPVGNAVLSSGIGGSVTMTTAANSIGFQTWVNNNNNQDAMSPGITSGTITTPLGALSNGDAFSNSNDIAGAVAVTPFSMTSLIDVTLGATGALNFSSSAVVRAGPNAGAPEAGSFVIWSLLAGSVGLVVKRKKTAVLGG